MSTLEDGHPNVKAAIAAMGNSEVKRKQTKKPKTANKDDGGGLQKPSASTKKREGTKDNTKSHLQPSRRNRVTDEFATKGRKYKDSLNKRLKDVISCLLETREDLTKAQICEKKNLDLDDVVLWEEVLSNQRIKVLQEQEKFRYRPRHPNICNKEKLLMHIRRQSQGTLWNEISDSYQAVATDLKSLVDEWKVFVIENPDIEDKVIFWNDPTVETMTLSSEVAELWKETQPPRDDLMYEELVRKTGIPPAPRKTARKREPVQKVPKTRKAKDFKYRKITNVHMPELFKSDQPEQID